MPTPTTKAAQVQEILRCGRDPQYFMNEYCKIQHPTRGLLPFKLFPFQDDCVNDFVKHRFNIVLKSRQLGLSTVTAAYACWMALFHKAKDILVIATKLKTAINFVKKIKTILKNLPIWLRISSWEDTRQEIRFSNGSYIQAIPTSEDAGRSEALSLLICDEAAHIRNFDEIWTAIYPTLSTGGHAIILSTPNGVGGEYYSLYTGAEAKTNDFNPIKLLWNVHPEHDQAWFDKESRQFSKRKVAQEMLCEFIGSGDTYITSDDISWLESIKCEPAFRGDVGDGEIEERNVWIWERPMVGHKYVLAADVARGDGRDYSTFVILNAMTGDVVVEYKGKIPPEKLGFLINKYGLLYNKALVCPEYNTFGYSTCSKLKELKYPRLAYQDVKPTMMETYVAQDGDKPGFSTQTKSRELALAKFEELVRNKVIKCYSARLINELRTFVWNGTKAMAMKDEHDDIVIAMAIACWLFDAIYGVTTKDYSSPADLLKSFHRSKTKFSTVPGNGSEVKPFMKPGMLAYSVYKPNTSRPNSAPQLDDFKWLVR